MLLELLLRPQTPHYLRIAGLVLMLLALVFFSISPGLLTRNRVLATLPVQRFKWASETYLSSAFNRVVSIAMVSLAFGIFIYSHFMSSSLAFFENEALNFTIFLLVIALLVGLKLLTMKTFFFIHDQEEIGTMVIDFQYAYNFLLSLILVLVIAADLYFYRLSNSLYITASIVVGILFLMRLMGSILLLLNKFTYPIISLFIYLCAFEIVPMLVIAKVIFVKS